MRSSSKMRFMQANAVHEVEEIGFGHRLIQPLGHEAGDQRRVTRDGLVGDGFFLTGDVDDEQAFGGVGFDHP